MSSLLTNSSAMTALQTLTLTNKNLETTQNRISTGLRINDASDGAAYWSIATTMRSDNEALSAVQDALGLGAATVDTAFTAMNNSISQVNSIKKLVTAASEGTLDKSDLQKEMTLTQEQLRTNAESSSFNGVNWVAQNTDDASNNTVKDVVGGFTRDTSGNVAVQKIEVETENSILVDAASLTGTGTNIGILTRDVSADLQTLANAKLHELNGTTTATADLANLQFLRDGSLGSVMSGTTLQEFSFLEMDISGLDVTDNDKAVLAAVSQLVDDTLSDMTDAATNLGSTKSRIDAQATFTQALMDSISRGIGQLVDADMNAESTRLQALQTQQQLGIQALSIANQGASNILSLFR
ncbi:flagellin [Roseibium sp. RKSG952]|uniref:flagellin N-terminal helical domain-containing protein n=1 Tax=Roseibium sp. RKSG952 TaxID=2529384 RepID=UPI0012BC8C98|nr:flagellin [Roseibium sp. RKSG952]MTH98291.1 flagellin [Roseibium sp. RKSG952]